MSALIRSLGVLALMLATAGAASADLPAPWQDADVGAVGAAGTASYDAGTFTVTGSGADIWNNADEFHFVYQTTSGDFEISARVASVGDTGPWGMAGVMIRDGLSAGAKHGIASVTRSQGLSFTWRENAGGSSSFQPGTAETAPTWVKLRRVGNQLTALRSSDGSAWVPFGSATVAMPNEVTIGLAVSAVNDGALNTSTFDNVEIGPPGSEAVPTVSVDPAVMYQKMDGIGVNANHRSWRGGELIPALDRLIDEAGMRLFRVVFDLSDWEDPNDNADAAVMNQPYYDALYATPRFEPLWEMAEYLNSRGITDGLMFNFMGWGPDWMGGHSLAPGMEDEWAEMITSLLVYARNVRGIDFKLVAPNNEPNISNEGISTADGAQYAAALHALAQHLDAAGLGDVRLVAPDLAGGGTAYLPELLADDVVMAKIARFGVHSYSGGGGGSSGVGDLIAASDYPQTPFWMTEFNVWCDGCDQGVPGDYNWEYTRGTAEYLFDHLANGAAGATVWEGYDSSYAHHAPAPWSFWGILRVDDIHASSYTYSPRKNFYTVAQFSRFIAAGDVRIGVSTTESGVDLQAYMRPSTGGVAVVGLNDNDAPTDLVVDVSGLPAVTTLQLVQTTSSLSFDYGLPIDVVDGQVHVTVAADAVFTLTSDAIGDVPSCPPAPSFCRTPIEPQASTLSLRKSDDALRDSLSWSWKNGQAVDFTALGDPTAADAYDVCLYDGGALIQGWVAPAGGSCGGTPSAPRPCWRAKTSGYSYSDKGLSPSGLLKIKLQASPVDGESAASVKGKGAALALTTPDALLGPLDVQIRRHDGGACMGATFSAPFASQSATKFSARSD